MHFKNCDLARLSREQGERHAYEGGGFCVERIIQKFIKWPLKLRELNLRSIKKIIIYSYSSSSSSQSSLSIGCCTC